MSFYQEYLPDNSVKQFIKCYWIYENKGDELSEDIVTHNGCSNIVFTIYGTITEQGPNYLRSLPKTFVFPAGHRPSKFSYEKLKCVGIRLQPWANLTFIKSFFFDQVNEVVDIKEYYNNKLAGMVDNGQHKTNEQIIDLVESLSLELIKFQRSIDQPFKDVIHKIIETKGELSIETICRVLRLTQRGLELKFQKNVGSSPKFFLQKIRFHNFLRSALACQNSDLTQLALNTGYYDQSHLIRASKKFTGLSPSRLVPILTASNGLNKKVNFSF